NQSVVRSPNLSLVWNPRTPRRSYKGGRGVSNTRLRRGSLQFLLTRAQNPAVTATPQCGRPGVASWKFIGTKRKNGTCTWANIWCRVLGGAVLLGSAMADFGRRHVFGRRHGEFRAVPPRFRTAPPHYWVAPLHQWAARRVIGLPKAALCNLPYAER